jgi:hypothetical protein
MGERASILLAVMIMAGASMPPAHADPDTNLSTFYTSDTLCGTERATLDAGTANAGRGGADIYSAVNDGGTPCAKAASLDPAYLAQQVWVYYRNPDTGEIGLCAYTEWYYNEAKVAHFGIYSDSIAALCGTGDYRITAHGAIGVNDQWHPGNSMILGWQHFQAPAKK